MSLFFSLIIMGIVQGLTEFLPVSSSGHLVLLGKLFHIEENLFVSIIFHLATLISIVIVFRKKILYFCKHPFCAECKKLVVATIPTCLIVLVIMPILNQSFEGNFLPICFMITSLLLLITNLFFENNKNSGKITYKQSFVMGIFQGVAVFPGISRSGSTICGGLISKGNKDEVAEFSFLMSIPIILLSLVKEIYEIIKGGEVIEVDIAGLIVGSIFACLIGIFSIKFMINLTKKVKFVWFSIYLFVISILSFFIIY